MAKASDQKYIEGVGRRKTAVARVRLTPAAKSSYKVNGMALADYFTTLSLQKTAEAAFAALEGANHYEVTVQVLGGGKAAQAESMRLGVARALVSENETTRKLLKPKGFLKRDPRSKERKKFGLKKARKAAQWSKR
ncbi:MAG: ribosomal protein small subunit ribosomal protein [Candidatus Parcubacteria bacterium]|jgi:small subunit ribosomal protein S9